MANSDSTNVYTYGLNERQIARFWSFVPKTDGCWIWKGTISRDGRARFAIGNGNVPASRVMMELVGRPVPVGMFACHHCDNGRCVNPDHIFIGTLKDNSQDMSRKGRAKPFVAHGDANPSHIHKAHRPRGSAMPFAKLNESQISLIRAAVASGRTRTSVAKEFGVSLQVVSEICLRRSWQHVR